MGSSTDSNGQVTHRVRIGDRLWRIRFREARAMGRDWGRCDHPPGRHPTIEIRRSLSELNILDTLVHEILHAARPELDEEAIDKTAACIARALYQTGWRRTLD